MNTEPPTTRQLFRNYLLSAIFGSLGGVLTIGTIIVLDSIIHIIWTKGFGMNVDDPSRTFASIIMLVLFGLGIGLLAKKYGPAKGSIETVIEESLTDGVINPKLALKNIGYSLLSIGSGASLGPEAPAAMVTAGSASLLTKKLGLSNKTGRVLSLSSVAGMLGALLSSPFVAVSMFVEFSKGSMRQLHDVISYGLIAGSFGLATFFAIFKTFYALDFGIPSYSGLTVANLTDSFVFGLFGAVFAVVIGLIMRAIEPFFVRLDKKMVVRSVIGAFFAGIVAFLLPLTMFSGQHTMSTMIDNAATTSIAVLLALALGKILATTVLLRTGFFGGPIFPAIFAGAALGIACNGLLQAPLAIAIAGTIAGMITVMLRAPLSAAVVVIAIIGTNAIEPAAIGVCAGLLVVGLINQKTAKAATNET